MILLREIREDDLSDVQKMADIPGLINLPSNPEYLREKIRRSSSSFRGRFKDPSQCKFLFVAEDLEKKKVIGTSMIASQHGTVESPHFFFEIGEEKKYSRAIKKEFVHETLELKFMTDGPSEIGGLVVDPSERDRPEKVGRQLSLLRFLYLETHRHLFKDKIIAELLPPFDVQGRSPLWEAIGRQFTQMDYWDADELCQREKEFIHSLFPHGKIYTAFLPKEARDSIGKVNPMTEPVYHLLTRIGFHYNRQIDPFDGGPHLWANVGEVVPIRNMREGLYVPKLNKTPEGHASQHGLIAKKKQRVGQFRAISAEVVAIGNEIQVQQNVDEIVLALGLKKGDPIFFMPYF